MIPYRKFGWGLHLLFRLYGSAVMRTCMFGALAALQTVLLYTFTSVEQRQSYYEKSLPSLTFPAFAGMVAFLVIFRQNFSYGRYHEGRTRVQAMTASFFTAFSLALSFDKQPTEASLKDSDDESKFKRRSAEDEFINDLTHGMSLVHALCLQHLRCDWELGNLSTHDEDFLPPWDSTSTPGFKVSLWRYILPHDRTKGRMKWNRASKIQVIGGITNHERSALNALGPERMMTVNRKTEKLPVGVSKLVDPASKPSIAGCCGSLWTSDTATIVRGAVERPYKVFYAVMEVIRRRFEAGGINMPAPILSTIWQNIGAGIANFEHCCYLQDTPFPFQWAQLIVCVLLIWQIVIPFTVVTIHNEALGITISVVTTWVLWALNEVAREIEDPFVSEPNDLPLARLQYQFNEMLLAVAASAVTDNGDELGWSVPETKWNAVRPPDQGLEGENGASQRSLSPATSLQYNGGLGRAQDSDVGVLGV